MQYNIEDNFDFYSELLKIKNGMEEPKLKEDGENVCLISNIQLTDKYVTLTCGHKFNYIPLYHDVYNQKTKYNTKENNIDRLKYYEIRCPYCRKKQNKLLPYYPELISESNVTQSKQRVKSSTVVAPSTGGSAYRGNRVRMTQDQLRMARELGINDEAGLKKYAQEIQKSQRS